MGFKSRSRFPVGFKAYAVMSAPGSARGRAQRTCYAKNFDGSVGSDIRASAGAIGAKSSVSGRWGFKRWVNCCGGSPRLDKGRQPIEMRDSFQRRVPGPINENIWPQALREQYTDCFRALER